MAVDAFDVGWESETLTGLVEKSSPRAAVVVAGAAVGVELHMASCPGVPLEVGTVVVEDLHSTFEDFVGVVWLARHTCCVADRVHLAKQLMLANSTVEYDRKWEGMDATFEQRP